MTPTHTPTPGPWEWSTGDPDRRVPSVYSINDGPIAAILTKNHADARLIAKAPELLNALRSILDLAQIDSDTKPLALEALSQIRREARALLAEIEGTK